MEGRCTSGTHFDWDFTPFYFSNQLFNVANERFLRTFTPPKRQKNTSGNILKIECKFYKKRNGRLRRARKEEWLQQTEGREVLTR